MDIVYHHQWLMKEDPSLISNRMESQGINSNRLNKFGVSHGNGGEMIKSFSPLIGNWTKSFVFANYLKLKYLYVSIAGLRYGDLHERCMIMN